MYEKNKKKLPRERVLDALRDKGLVATLIGLAMLGLTPILGSSTPVLRTVASGLGKAAWPALLLGLTLLGVHHLLSRKRPAPAPTRPAAGAGAERQGDPHTRPLPSPESAIVWGPAVFAGIEWRRFEALCEALFAQAGYQTRSQSYGAEGGADIWLHAAQGGAPVGLVQCKHWLARPVGEKEMRQFFGILVANKLWRGTYATSGSYTPEAAQFAREHRIHLLDGMALLGLIAERTPKQQLALLHVAHEGEYWRPTCASCGEKMVERKVNRRAPAVWGCLNFPRCRDTLPMAAAR